MANLDTVMKALDCEEYSKCSECPYVRYGKCNVLLIRDVKELLNSKQAEIERLKGMNRELVSLNGMDV